MKEEQIKKNWDNHSLSLNIIVRNRMKEGAEVSSRIVEMEVEVEVGIRVKARIRIIRVISVVRDRVMCSSSRFLGTICQLFWMRISCCRTSSINLNLFSLRRIKHSKNYNQK